MTDKPKAQWTEVKRIEDEPTGLAVRITVSDGPHPRYSVDVGRMYNNNFIPHLRPDLKIIGGVVSLVPLDLTVLGRLIHEAEYDLKERAQAHEDSMRSYSPKLSNYIKTSKQQRGRV